MSKQESTESTTVTLASANAELKALEVPFGRPSFAFPRIARSSKDGKTVMHAIATVPLYGGVYTIEAVVWRKTVDDNVNFSVSLPRGIDLTDKRSDAVNDADCDAANYILSEMDKWENATTASGKIRKAAVLTRRAK